MSEAVRECVLEGEGLVKEFQGGDGGMLRVLDDVASSVRRGEVVAIVWTSGAGMSPLLRELALRDRQAEFGLRLGERQPGFPPEHVAVVVAPEPCHLGRCVSRGERIVPEIAGIGMAVGVHMRAPVGREAGGEPRPADSPPRAILQNSRSSASLARRPREASPLSARSRTRS